MPIPPLSGPPGICIRSRLESAAAIFDEPVNGWEDLRMYLINDEKWTWDNTIVLLWQQDITDYFLKCCKEYHDDKTIASFATRLRDGQQLEEDMKVGEASGLLEEDSDHGTIMQPNYTETPKSDKIIFLVNWGKKTSGGASVNYSNIPISRIRVGIVQRWECDNEMYETLIPGERPGHNSVVIDLTWQVERGGKTHTTTFEVVSDSVVECDAEFGKNRFHPILSKIQEKGHSFSKSVGAVETPHKAKPTGPRSHGESPLSTTQRRQTMPTSLGRLESLDKKDFVQRRLIQDLMLKAELEWEMQKNEALEEADDEDDEEESVASGRGLAHSTPGTSVDTKKSDRTRHKKH